MPTLLLKMSGPLQSWGTQSRFRRRDAGHEPSKSGVIGMVAAALGRSRNEPVDDLVSLKFAVRTDASGTLIRDYQTAKNWAKNPKGAVSLSTRMYLSDAVFVVALEGEREQLETIESALKKPVCTLDGVRARLVMTLSWVSVMSLLRRSCVRWIGRFLSIAVRIFRAR